MIAEIDTKDTNKIVLLDLPLRDQRAATIPGYSGAGGKDPRFPKSWATCLALRGVFGDELEVGPELTAWSKDEYKNRVAPCMKLRDAMDAEGEETLYPFQRAGVQFLAHARQALLADDMGTGKTRQSLSALKLLKERGEEVFPLLVVAPKNVKTAWKREIDEVWPGLKVSIVKGSAVQRRKLLEEPADIYIVNWESLRHHSRLAPYPSVSLKRCKACGGYNSAVTETQCEVHDRELNAIDFKSVIADEIHRALDPKSKQTRGLWAATGNAEFRIGLSGTPTDRVDKLWTVLHWLSPSEWPNKSKFIDRMCVKAFSPFHEGFDVVGIRPEMKEEYFKALDPRLRRMPSELVTPFLPPKIYETRYVEMSPKQATAYKTMKKQMIADIDNGLLVVTNPMIVHMRLLQFASSYASLEERWNPKYDNHDGTFGAMVPYAKLQKPSSKIDAFLEDLEDFGDRSIVVFAVSKQLIDLLSEEMTKRKIDHGLIVGGQSEYDRQEYVDAFQDGSTKILLCTIQAAGASLTLTKASVAVYLQRPWSMFDNMQSEKRMHRIGSEQHDSILYVDYVAEDTVESDVIEGIQKKSDQLEEILRDTALLRKLLDNEPAKPERRVRKKKEKVEDADNDQK